MTFAEAWDYASKIEGWFSRKEAEVLFNAAMDLPPRTIAVEVGSYCGRSTAVIAAAGHWTWAVDPMEDMSVTGREWPIMPEHVNSLARVVEHFDSLIWYRQTSETMVPAPAPVTLLHVDGCHFHPWPLRDFENFEPHMVPGTKVLFHDIVDAVDVREAVDLLVANKKLGYVQTVASLCELVYIG